MILVSVPNSSTSLETIVSGHADIIPFRDVFVQKFTKLVIFNGWADPIHICKRITATPTNSQAIANGQSLEVYIEDFLKTFLITDGAWANAWVILRLEK